MAAEQSSLPSTRYLIKLLTDNMFSYALRMLDPSLLTLADQDDVHARFLACLVRMSALVQTSSEDLRLPRSLVTRLFNIANEGSADAAFCMHWIVLFALERDEPRAQDFGPRVQGAVSWLMDINTLVGGCYGKY
jgi:hypothetical protein